MLNKKVSDSNTNYNNNAEEANKSPPNSKNGYNQINSNISKQNPCNNENNTNMSKKYLNIDLNIKKNNSSSVIDSSIALNSKLNSKNNQNYNTSDRAIYSSVDAKYEELFKKLDGDFLPVKLEYEKKIEKINKIVLQLDSDIQLLKSNLEILFSKQRQYYIDLLNKGIDVRSEGLKWIVKRLIELNTVIDYGIFPRFLEKSQIDYIIYISYKSVEISQIKILMKMLRARHLKESKIGIVDSGLSLKNSEKETPKSITNCNLHLEKKNVLNLREKKNNHLNSNSKNKLEHKVKFIFNSVNEENLKSINPENNKNTIKDLNLTSNEAPINNNFDNKTNEVNFTNENCDDILINYDRLNSCEIFFNTFYTGKKSVFYLKSFSEKALNIFDNIFQKYEIIGKKKLEFYKKDKKVR